MPRPPGIKKKSQAEINKINSATNPNDLIGIYPGPGSNPIVMAEARKESGGDKRAMYRTYGQKMRDKKTAQNKDDEKKKLKRQKKIPNQY